ncbi:ribonuclease H-like domain-containing protein [Lineolata rhizophorae]|uniref:Ribonuclease n=1 Tax=Lineolata rhizophorae TaxID=578093 RepID=A0A6A6NT02_9PEZI|nr:ribonuclease H-like domain-containing protein [Lineolata rhizophorae]
MDGVAEEPQDLALETPAEGVFIPPSIDRDEILAGRTHTHYSPVPDVIAQDPTTECVLGIDEAGRGPVLGPMVYAALYLPASSHDSLLRTTHRFADSKALTPAARSSLMRALCTAGSDLHRTCGWATAALSARAIAAGMLRPAAAGGARNLNAQAADATAGLIAGVLARGVAVAAVFVDALGPPAAHQARLAARFPNLRVTVANKADAIYPCVSAASVCAKVSRDAALDVCYGAYAGDGAAVAAETGWGSGYPSDARCSAWLRRNMDPLFGWGAECRFSWSTARDMLEEGSAGSAVGVDWPEDDEDDDERRMTDFFAIGPGSSAAIGSGGAVEADDGDELSGWYGRRVAEGVF